MWKKVEVGEEGICIRDEEKRDDKVGLGSQEIVTAQYTMLHVPWMCWMDTIQYAYGPDMLMYDGWLIISLSAWGKMTGCQSSALLCFALALLAFPLWSSTTPTCQLVSHTLFLFSPLQSDVPGYQKW